MAPRRKKVWLVLDRNDVATLILALEAVFDDYSPNETAAGLVDDENRLWELLTEKLRAHDLGKRSTVKATTRSVLQHATPKERS